MVKDCFYVSVFFTICSMWIAVHMSGLDEPLERVDRRLENSELRFRKD